MKITDLLLQDMEQHKKTLEEEKIESDQEAFIDKKFISTCEKSLLNKIKDKSHKDKFLYYSMLSNMEQIFDVLFYEYKHSPLGTKGYKFYEFLDTISDNMNWNWEAWEEKLLW